MTGSRRFVAAVQRSHGLGHEFDARVGARLAAALSVSPRRPWSLRCDPDAPIPELSPGDRDGDESYNAREKIVRETVLKHGKILSGPSSWQNRPGYRLFQGRRSATNTGYDGTGNRIE